MTVNYLVSATLLMACAAPVADAQPAPTAAPPMHLDVSVTDASGRPVRDLAVSEFEVSVDGQRLPVASVTQVSGRRSPEMTGGTVVRGRVLPAQVAHDVLRNDDAVDRYVVIVLDDITSSESDAGASSWVSTVGLDLARAVIDRISPDDRGSVFFSFMGRQQGLTSDRGRLRAAVDGLTYRRVVPADCPARESVDACVIDTLQRVADGLPAVPVQRKVVLFISERTPLPMVALPPDGQMPATAAQRTLQSLLAVNAVVYGITPQGPTRLENAGATFSLAEVTGGRVLRTSDPESVIAAIFEDLDSYYVLTLQAPQQDGAYREVSVQVSRAGTTVRARRGLFASDGVPTALPDGASTPMEAALVAPHQVRDVPMGASVAVFGVPGRREAVVSIAAAITSSAAPGATTWQAEVASTAFDPQWRPLASHRQTIEVTTQPDVGPRTVDVLSAVELLPGRYQIRVAAESSGRAGSVFVDVDVPEFQTTTLTASGAVVSTLDGPYEASPLLAQTLPVTPTTRRLFLRHEMVDVLVRFYQGGRNRMRNLPVSLRIADAGGEAIIQGTEIIPPSQFTAARSTDWRFTLPLDRLLPGEYLLAVDAGLDDRTVTRHVRFAVMP